MTSEINFFIFFLLFGLLLEHVLELVVHACPSLPLKDRQKFRVAPEDGADACR